MPENYWNHNTAFHDEIVADAAVLHHLLLEAGLESLAEIRRAAARILPGSRVRRRFYYRWTLTWDRPGAAS